MVTRSRNNVKSQRWDQFLEKIGVAQVSEYRVDFDDYAQLWNITPRAVRNQIDEWLEEGRITPSPGKPTGRGNPCYISYEGSWKLEVGSFPPTGDETSNFQLPTSTKKKEAKKEGPRFQPEFIQYRGFILHNSEWPGSKEWIDSMFDDSMEAAVSGFLGSL